MMTIEERQEAAKWFQNRASHTSMPEAKMMFERAAEALSEGMQPRWIPCSERLPEEDEDVLLQFSSNMGVGFYQDGWAVNTGEGIYSAVDMSEEKPIAWMPLPKPYGGENE